MSTDNSISVEEESIDHYNILLASSSELFKQVLVVMMSAILNSGKPCHFYIMQSDWNSDLKSQCTSFVSMHPDNEVYFLEVDDSKLNFLKPFKGKYGTYYKLFAHEYLPTHVKRILYLDADVMIRKDISDFYFDDFEDLYFIAINSLMEMNPKFKNKDFNPKQNELCLRKSTNSNPGVLLINVDKLRQENFNIEYYKGVVSQISGNYWYEEGILNYLFTYKRKYVPAYKWQTMMGFIDRYKKVFSLDKKTREEEYNEFYSEDFDEKNELAIIHFVLPKRRCKPWQTTYKGTNVYDKFGKRLGATEELFYTEWWKIAAKLPLGLFCQLIMDAKDFEANESVNQVKKFSSYTSNALNFCYEVSLDVLGEHKFERYIKSLSGRNVALLKYQDKAAAVLKKEADACGVDIVFTSDKAILQQLSEEEFAECKKADVIITCCVHGTKTHERDGVKCIDIWDILKDISLTAGLLPLQTTNEISAFTAELKAMSEQNAQLIKSISEYNSDLESIDRLTQIIENLHVDKSKLSVELGRVDHENEVLKEKLSKSAEEYQDLNNSYNALQSKMKDAQAKCDELQNETARANKSASQLKKEADEAKQEIERLNKKIFAMENSRSWRYTKIFRGKQREEQT